MAENEGCMSAAVVNGFDDSGATLAAGESDGTDNLTCATARRRRSRRPSPTWAARPGADAIYDTLNAQTQTRF